MDNLLFPFSTHAWLYVGFLSGIIALLALDLGLFHRKAKEVSLASAAAWSAIWVGLALLFNAGLYAYTQQTTGDAESAKRISLEFLAGFLVEKSLAVDNIFIFVLVFSAFAIPPALQHRVLFYGILGALVFRVIFIAAGAWLMQYHFIVVLFGIFLVITGGKILFAKDKKADPEKNIALRLLRRIMPVTKSLHGEKFLIKLQGRWHATPLLAALIVLEASDILFAVDSVPAIFALTKEPFIVLTSNVFAILGLRSLFFLVAGAMQKLRFLSYGLGIILIFVGLKMSALNALFGGKFPITWSLLFITTTLAITALASWLFPAPSVSGPEEPGAPAPKARSWPDA